MAGSFIGLTREAFDKLDEALGKVDDIGAYVEDWLDENGGQYIEEYLTEHGIEVGYTVTDGDLSITLA